MSQSTQLAIYKSHLQKRYNRLLEKTNEYKFIDESTSDNAAFKAMKILSKLNQLEFLQPEIYHLNY